VSEKQRENDFERETSRLNDGLKTCRAVMDNYRTMIAGEQPQADKDDSEIATLPQPPEANPTPAEAILPPINA
jgi:hypothetical protein